MTSQYSYVSHGETPPCIFIRFFNNKKAKEDLGHPVHPTLSQTSSPTLFPLDKPFNSLLSFCVEMVLPKYHDILSSNIFLCHVVLMAELNLKKMGGCSGGCQNRGEQKYFCPIIAQKFFLHSKITAKS